jgi:hypothetical protein
MLIPLQRVCHLTDADFHRFDPTDRQAIGESETPAFKTFGSVERFRISSKRRYGVIHLSARGSWKTISLT